jgi:hypothetical protein
VTARDKPFDRGCIPDFVAGIGTGNSRMVTGSKVIVIAQEENHRAPHLPGWRAPEGARVSRSLAIRSAAEGDTLVVETSLKSADRVERIRNDSSRRVRAVDGRAMLANWRPE